MTPTKASSYVVTGGAQGVGRAIAERLGQDGPVVVLDLADRLEGAVGTSLRLVSGDAGDPATAAEAASTAEDLAPLAGWVNNAAVFRDASLRDADATAVLDLVVANLRLAVTGCGAAVRHLLEHGRPGAIVNVSSHQARRPVRGALPYATAKAGVEGLTRAAAVDHGPDGIRTCCVALGSVVTDRWEELRAARPDVEAEVAALHPLGRAGTTAEVAEVVAFLLSPAAGFVNGVVLPVDGGRSAYGPDPEAR